MHTNPVEIILMFSTGFVAFAFVLSGLAKLTKSTELLESMSGLGVPRFAQRRWIAAAVPVWELCLALGLLLLPGIPRAGAAVLAAGTLIVFTTLVVRVLVRGESVDCGCFGALSVDDRITTFTVVRNASLLIASCAIIMLAPPAGSFITGLVSSSAMTIVVTLLAWAALVSFVLGISLVRLRRRSTSVSAPVPGAEPGAAVGDRLPSAELVTAEGVTVQLNALGRGSPVLLVFLSAGCGKCAATAARLPEWQQQISPVLLKVATSSRPDELRAKAPEVLPFAHFGARSASTALGANALPSAVLLGGMAHPFISSPVAHGEKEIEALVAGIVEATRQLPG